LIEFTTSLELLCLPNDNGPFQEESAMLDAAFITAGIGFFAICASYALICVRL
jgi:hypothetical protein